MIETNKYGDVIINERVKIEHEVLYCGVGPQITITDLEEDQAVSIQTKQEAEQVIKACEDFLKHLGTWDWVHKDI